MIKDYSCLSWDKLGQLELAHAACKDLDQTALKGNLVQAFAGSTTGEGKFHMTSPNYAKYTQAASRTVLSCFQELYSRLLSKAFKTSLATSFNCQNFNRIKAKTVECIFQLKKKTTENSCILRHVLRKSSKKVESGTEKYDVGSVGK